MANELTLTAALSFTKGSNSASASQGPSLFSVIGTNYVKETMSVPTSATAIPLGSITTPGYIFIQNTDAGNYVDILDSTGGNACVRLLPGEFCLMRFAAVAPAAKAHTSPVVIQYCLIET